MPPGGRGSDRPARPRRAGRPAGGTERLTRLIAPVANDAGFDLEQVTVSRIGRRHRVQVIIDGDHGVGLDAIAEVSQAVSTALDAAEESGDEVLSGEYVLEVSSPGVDRPLTEPRHWRRNADRLVTVAGPDGRALTGRIVTATDEGVALAVDGTIHELAYAQLGPGRVQVELRRLDQAGDDEDEAGADEGEGEA